MADQLQKSGVDMDAEEVRVKIKNLTAKYRAEKASTGSSGGSSSEWCYFHQVHEILGSFRCENADTLIEESLECALSPPSTSTSSTMSVPPPEPSPPSSPSSSHASIEHPPPSAVKKGKKKISNLKL